MTTKQQHTPGPWQHEGRKVLKFYAGMRPSESVGSIALCHGEDAEANARLIAAAPELLAACEAVQRWLLDSGPLKDDGMTHPLFIKANNLVSAAILKAERVTP